jgi:hypothetical protein
VADAVRDHRIVTAGDKAVDALVAKYREVLPEMDARTIERGEKPRSWSQLVNHMQALQLRLRATQAGRDAITSFVGDENATVRSWSAVNALAWILNSKLDVAILVQHQAMPGPDRTTLTQGVRRSGAPTRYRAGYRATRRVSR